MKRKISLLLSVALIATMALTGCGQKETAQSLLKSSYKNVKDESFEMDGNVDLSVDVSYQESASVTVPVTLDFTAKRNENNMYLEGNAKVSMFGEETNTQIKYYLEYDNDKVNQYVCTSDASEKDDTSEWSVSTVDLKEHKDYMNSMSNLDIEKLFKDAKMEKKGKSYVVTESLKSLIGSAYFKDTMMQSLTKLENDKITDENKKQIETALADISKQLSESNIEYTIEDSHIMNVNIKDFEATYDYKQEDTNMGIKVKFNINADIKNYGKVNKKDVEVPQEVKDSAISDDASSIID